jgi:hypothetical protein
LLARDENGNVFRGEALARSSSGNYVDAEGKLIALVGVNDLVVVDTPGRPADRRPLPLAGSGRPGKTAGTPVTPLHFSPWNGSDI